MPGCAAIGCNNRSEKGYTMKCFPRDPVLRQMWKDRVGRADWEPSNNSFLCHAHFAPSQWMVTQCGRLKLRKGAIPSIFRIVSTRKSPNKRRRSGTDGKSEEDELGLETLEDDEENYVYLETPGRTQNFGDESIVFLDSENSSTLPNTKGKEGNSLNNVYQIIGSLNDLQQHENVIVISDDNSTGMGSFASNGNNYIIINSENENTINQIEPMEILTNHMPPNSRIKVEIKDETDGQITADEIYDEVESNMERIYEGINTDDESTNQNRLKLKVIANQTQQFDSQTEANKLNLQNSVSISNGHAIVDLNDLNACLKNSRFSNGINNGIFMVEDTEDEEILDTRETEAIPNLEAALLRKRKAREETMKSIERFMSDTVEEIAEKSQNCSYSDDSSANCNRSKRSKNNKFAIQFSGGIDDVSDIMRDLSEKPLMECSLVENENQSHENVCITSVIRVENNFKKIIKTEKISNSDSEGIISDDLVKCSSKFPLKQETVQEISSDSEFNVEFIDENQDQNHHQDLYQNEDLDDQDHEVYEEHNQVFSEDHEVCEEQNQEPSEDHDYQDVSTQSTKRIRNSDSECRIDSSELYYDLKLKIEQQEGTISKLTNHLSTYKDMENKLQELNDELKLKNKEISILSAKLNRKEASQGRSERNFTAMQALIKDLTHKVKTVEDVNRRLSRSISLEHQNKKNLEYQVRSREKTIKELNWKVDKASKLLERADRNANNYKRRVNNMRSLIKRKHLDFEHEKQTPFDSLFSDYVKHEFSNESLRMALKIQNLCGSNGYEVLLNYNFPLPSLRTLRRRLQRNFDFTNGSDKMMHSLISNFDIDNSEITNASNTNLENDDCDIIEIISPERSLTVIGTVQDIFDETNYSDPISENEEMSEKELQKHLFQFNKVNF